MELLTQRLWIPVQWKIILLLDADVFCPECSERFTTYERVDTIPLTVVKSDETRESFDRGKILKGMLMSCNKRPVSVEELEKVVTSIENSFINSNEKKNKQ